MTIIVVHHNDAEIPFDSEYEGYEYVAHCEENGPMLDVMSDGEIDFHGNEHWFLYPMICVTA